MVGGLRVVVFRPLGRPAQVLFARATACVQKEVSVFLEGSCHCGAVRFSLQSAEPYPFNLCYCSICRKTAGGGGFAINLGGDYASMRVSGEAEISVYQARLDSARASPSQRHFCRRCGSALWVWDPRWPELVHPFASAMDTPLPQVPEQTHLMLASKPAWVRACVQPADRCHDEYPDETLAEWHARVLGSTKQGGAGHVSD